MFNMVICLFSRFSSDVLYCTVFVVISLIVGVIPMTAIAPAGVVHITLVVLVVCVFTTMATQGLIICLNKANKTDGWKKNITRLECCLYKMIKFQVH